MPCDKTWWSCPEHDAVAIEIWDLTPDEVNAIKTIIDSGETFFYMDLIPVHAEKGETQTLCSIPFMTPLSPTLRAVLVQLAGLDMVEACFLPNGDKSLHTEEHECETYEEMTPITPEWRQHILNELSKALTTQGDGISSEP